MNQKPGYALITGASSGIGVEFAKQLAPLGYPLILVARRKERLEALAASLKAAHKVDVVVIAQDLSEPNAAQTLHDHVKAAGHRVDILINNAGVGMQGKFLEMDFARVEQMLRLNITCLLQLTQLYAREMQGQGGGHILQVASMASFVPPPYVSAYGATKAFVWSFSESVRYELRNSGVSVTTLYPGITPTEFGDVAEAKTPPMLKPSILSAAKVAQIGLRAMFRRRRAVIPGFINKTMTFFSSLMPRGMLIRSAGSMLEKENQL